jgi:hypothetical protein
MTNQLTGARGSTFQKGIRNQAPPWVRLDGKEAQGGSSPQTYHNGGLSRLRLEPGLARGNTSPGSYSSGVTGKLRLPLGHLCVRDATCMHDATISGGAGIKKVNFFFLKSHFENLSSIRKWTLPSVQKFVVWIRKNTLEGGTAISPQEWRSECGGFWVIRGQRAIHVRHTFSISL